MELFYRYLARREIDLNDYYLATGYGLDREEYQDFTRRLLAGLEERGYPARLVGEFPHRGDHWGAHRPHAHRRGHPEKRDGLPWRSAGPGKLKKDAPPENFFPGGASY